MANLPENTPSRLGKTTTIGLLVDWIGDPYHQAIMSGVLEAAAAANVNVLCFVGGQIPANPAEGVHHRVFELVTPHLVDGVAILTTAMMHQVGRTGIEAYCKAHFNGLPYYSMGVALDGVPSDVLDNAGGVEASIAHLAQVHGHRRIAFIRGPLANDEAERRYLAYVESLKKRDLLFDPRLVAEGNFMQSGGREAVRQFAQLPGMRLEDLDAIVASNDSMAIGALSALEERGIVVPDTIALTGFDDIEESQLVASPLTTIRQPLSQFASIAIRDLVRWIQVGTVPESQQIGTELVVRRSCGCSFNTRNAAHSVVPETTYSFEASLVMRRQHILDTMTRVARGKMGGVGADWQAKLLNAFAAEMRGEKAGAFRFMLEDFARRLLARRADAQVCHDIADLLRRQLCPTLRAESARRDQAEDIFYATHLALSESIQRDLARDRLRLSRWVMAVSTACNAITSAFDLTELRLRIRDQLTRIGFDTYFVVVYSSESGFEQAQLLAGSDRGKDVGGAAAGHFEAKGLLPKPLRQSLQGGRVFSVMPLCWKAQLLGHVLFEFNLAQATAHGALADALGAGIHGAHMGGAL